LVSRGKESDYAGVLAAAEKMAEAKKELVTFIKQQELQSGVTLSGGDPFYQPEQILDLTNKLKENDINIWCYTGFVFENLVKDELYKKILNNIDVLVDRMGLRQIMLRLIVILVV
jgi:pyruvate-formate lyase-activating enzyme